MQSNDMFDIIGYLEELISTKEKTEVLAGCFDDADFRKVIHYALDPLKTFGIIKLPPFGPGRGDGEFNKGTWDILDALSQRRLTGNTAKEALTLEFGRLSPNSRELLQRILRKNLKIGIGAISANRAAKMAGLTKPLVTNLAYMRCSLPKHVDDLETWPWTSGGVFSEVKMDGMFASLSLPEDAGPKLLTRKGFEFEMTGAAWDRLLDDIKSLPRGERLEGELTVSQNGQCLPRKVGNGLLNSLLSGQDTLPGHCRIEYVVWDCVPLEAVAERIYKVPRRERKKRLNSILLTANCTVILPIEMCVVNSLEEARAHAEEVQRMGGEGTIFKHPEGIWKDGTSTEQVKLKCEHTADLRMMQLIPGDEAKRNAHLFGSIRCSTDDGLVTVDVPGYSDKIREDVFNNWEDVYEGKIMAIKFNELISAKNRENFSLYLPQHDEFRFDKDDTDSFASISAML